MLRRRCLPALAALALGLPRANAQDRDPRDPFDAIVREALANNLTLRQQLIARDRADAAVAQARGLYLPSVGIDARYTHADGATNVGDFINPAYAALNQLLRAPMFPTNIDVQLPYAQETRLRLVQPLFQPSVRFNHQLFASLSHVEDARTRAAARRVAADAQKAYFAAAKARRAVGIYRATLTVLDENARVANTLLENGKATPDAVFRARAERAEAAQQLAEAERQCDAATQFFNLVLGRPLDAPLPDIADSLVVRPLEITLDDAKVRAHAARDELAMATRSTDVARAQQRLAGAAWLPGVSLALDYGVQGQQYEFDQNHDVGMASLVLQWNLFNGGQDAARREQASLDVARARAVQRDLERQVELDVEQAWRAVDVARGAIGTARERLEAAQRGHDLVARRYREGMASQIELLDARRTFTAAQLNEMVTRYEYASRYAELERAAALRDITSMERQ